MFFRVFLCAMVFTFVSTLSYAGDGKQLLDSCNKAVDILNGNRGSEGTGDIFLKGFKYGYCGGVIKGVYDTMMVFARDKSQTVCVDMPVLSSEELIRKVTMELKYNPNVQDMLSMPDTMLIGTILVKNYRCEKSK